MNRLTLRLPDELSNALLTEAMRAGVSKTQFIRETLVHRLGHLEGQRAADGLQDDVDELRNRVERIERHLSGRGARSSADDR
ncbi:MAG: hypothetical protein ACJ762_06210 [Solirubrobacteraceae bacterium]